MEFVLIMLNLQEATLPCTQQLPSFFTEFTKASNGKTRKEALNKT